MIVILAVFALLRLEKHCFFRIADRNSSLVLKRASKAVVQLSCDPIGVYTSVQHTMLSTYIVGTSLPIVVRPTWRSADRPLVVRPVQCKQLHPRRSAKLSPWSLLLGMSGQVAVSSRAMRVLLGALITGHQTRTNELDCLLQSQESCPPYRMVTSPALSLLHSKHCSRARRHKDIESTRETRVEAYQWCRGYGSLGPLATTIARIPLWVSPSSGHIHFRFSAKTLSLHPLAILCL